MGRKGKSILVVAALGLVLAGCIQNEEDLASSVSFDGQVLSVSVALPSGSAEISGALIRVSAPDMVTIEKVLQFDGTRVHGAIENVPLGKQRHIEIVVTDPNGSPLYYGDGYSDLLTGGTVDVVIQLKPAAATLNVVGILPGGQPMVVDANTLALYRLDETDGTIITDQVGRCNGHIGTAVRSPGLVGGALSFTTGNFSHLDTNVIIPDGLPNGTLELFFMVDSSFDSTASYALFGTMGARCNLAYKDGALIFLKNHSNLHKHVIGKASLRRGTWYHVAGCPSGLWSQNVAQKRYLPRQERSTSAVLMTV